MTLLEFFQAFFRPIYLVGQGKAQRSIDQYEGSLAYWERFTGDPSLAQIDDYTCALFMTGLRDLTTRQGKRVEDNTVRKHCVHVQVVLDRTGPRSRKNPLGQTLLEEVPYLPKPSLVEREVEDHFLLEEIERILAHCHVPIAPVELADADRAVYWRQLILFDYNVGLRIGTLMRARWTMIKRDERGARIEIPPGHGTKKGHRIFPLNRFALEALEKMEPLTGPRGKWSDSGLIWPWRGWPNSQGWLQSQRRLILGAAGIPADRQFGFHGLRKALCTEIAEINPLASSLAAGHKDMRTTQRHYIGKKVLANASAKLPQPKMIEADPQRLLF